MSKLIKFKPSINAFSGKLYQKLLKSGPKKVKFQRTMKSKGGTPEYYRKKYKSIYGRIRHSPVGEKLVGKAREKTIPIKNQTKRFKTHVKNHVDLLNKQLDKSPTASAALTILPGIAVLGGLQYAEIRKRRKQRSDKGKKRGSYKK